MRVDELKTAAVGSKIWFAEEKRPYTVRARSERYLVCTKPFAAQKTTIYTIVDMQENVRGTENLIFSSGFETQQQCEEAIDRLEGRTPVGPWNEATEVSHRNRVPLNVARIEQLKAAA